MILRSPWIRRRLAALLRAHADPRYLLGSCAADPAGTPCATDGCVALARDAPGGG